MPMRLKSNDKDFEARFAELLGLKREVSLDVDNAVRSIIADVKARGDTALAELDKPRARVRCIDCVEMHFGDAQLSGADGAREQRKLPDPLVPAGAIAERIASRESVVRVDRIVHARAHVGVADGRYYP